MDTTPLLWLIGTAGSGKTTTAWALFSQLAQEGVLAAYVDADQVGMAYPAPSGDPDNERVKARGIGAVWAGFRAAGAQCLIVSGGVAAAETVADYAARTPGAALTLVELRVGAEERRERLIGRGGSEHLIEPAALHAARLERDPLTDRRVDTGGRSVQEVVALVRDRIGDWPGAPAGAWRPRGFDAPESAADGGVPMVWVCGPAGVGKSTVSFAVFMRLLASGAKASFIDLAQIGWCRPAAADDPGDHRLRARNLGALWRAHREAGAECLVVSGSGGGAATARGYLEAVPGCAPTVVRLDAPPEQLAERIRMRAEGIGVELPGDELRGLTGDGLERRIGAAHAEAALLEREGVGDIAVDTGGRTPDDIADEIAALIGPRPGAAPGGPTAR
ncbi:AAA family ATPase [Glycomyces sp. A-F 0318]|uniref:adenylyl-sulfate kinase n=1 Tax=Glycomyces amatae TaxID=2881355 RepID=UPI001E439BE1|nr:adenylyl-sulfate kinase [Glycomyces amatae]MCD0443377.1 AAA family ATPase [Glycomyces amatae]